jgi:hypothetical protein
MSEQPEQRRVSGPVEVRFGCGTYIALAAILIALWAIRGDLRRISYQLTLLNCTEQAELGSLCLAARKDEK